MKDERLAIRARDAWLGHPTFTSLDGLSSLAGLAALFPGVNHLVEAAAYRLPHILQLEPSDRVVQIGCGAGVLLRSLHAQVGFEVPPLGLESSSQALRVGMRLGGAAAIQMAAAAATALPLADESATVVLCGHTANRLTDAALYALYLEVRRVLRPGGRFLLWDFGPAAGLPGRVTRWLLARGGVPRHLRSYADYAYLASECRFGWLKRVDLKPFLLPPVPRVSVLLTKG